MLQFLLSRMAEFSPSVTLKIFLWVCADSVMQIDTFCFILKIIGRREGSFVLVQNWTERASELY